MLKLRSFNTRDALRAAACKGRLEAVRFFVEEGVDKDGADKEGQTPLMLATQNNHMAVVQFLEEYKTNKNKADMSLKNKTANTRDALRAAANKGCMEAVRFLVEEEVSQDDADNEGRTPLLIAIQSGHEAVARYLVEFMQIRSYIQDGCWGSAALMFAARKCDLVTMQWLLEQGVDKDVGDNSGHTALIVATYSGHLAAIGWLLEQGVDVNKAENDGWTPLHRAAYHGHPEIVTCLMNWGASLTARTNDQVYEPISNRLPIELASNEAIKQLIRDEEIRRRDHGYKRAVIPNPTDAERKRARLERGEDEDEAQSQGQAIASAVAEEDDGENDDSGSDVEY